MQNHLQIVEGRKKILKVFAVFEYILLFIGLYRFFFIMHALEEEYSFLEASNLYSLRLKTSC